MGDRILPTGGAGTNLGDARPLPFSDKPKPKVDERDPEVIEARALVESERQRGQARATVEAIKQTAYTEAAIASAKIMHEAQATAAQARLEADKAAAAQGLENDAKQARVAAEAATARTRAQVDIVARQSHDAIDKGQLPGKGPPPAPPAPAANVADAVAAEAQRAADARGRQEATDKMAAVTKAAAEGSAARAASRPAPAGGATAGQQAAEWKDRDPQRPVQPYEPALKPREVRDPVDGIVYTGQADVKVDKRPEGEHNASDAEKSVRDQRNVIPKDTPTMNDDKRKDDDKKPEGKKPGDPWSPPAKTPDADKRPTVVSYAPPPTPPPYKFPPAQPVLRIDDSDAKSTSKLVAIVVALLAAAALAVLLYSQYGS